MSHPPLANKIPIVNPSPDSPDIEPRLDATQIDAMLNHGIAATIKYARQNSPFYRAKLAKFPEIHGINDLHLLPITTKQQVSEHNEQFWCVGREKLVDLATTSGTTGVPTLYPITQADLDRLGLNEYLCFRRVGLSPADLVILAVTLDKCFMAGLAYFEGLRKLGATVVRVGAGSPAMLLSMIERLKPSAIVSVPSFLKRVAAYASQQGRDLTQSTVRKLICIGEPVPQSRLVPHPAGARKFPPHGAPRSSPPTESPNWPHPSANARPAKAATSIRSFFTLKSSTMRAGPSPTARKASWSPRPSASRRCRSSVSPPATSPS